MATLQNIRNHGAILLVVVGVAMLAFILGDFLNSGSSFISHNREYVGVIEGNKIHYTQYEEAQKQLTEVYKIESGRSDFDEDMSAQIRNQVWQMFMLDYTLQAQMKAIGMDVTAEELSQLCIGDQVHPIIRNLRAFYDETGQFNRDNLVRFLQSLQVEAENAEQAANIEQAKTYWLYWENAVRLTQMQDKYTYLLQQLVGANPLDAKYAFDARQNKVDVDYVMQPYHSVADSLIKITEGDLRKIYDSRKVLYKQEPNRSLEYVTFAIAPSQDDFQKAEELMKSLQEDFATVEDITTVVNIHSDVTYDGRNYSESTVPEMFKLFAFSKKAKKNNVTDIIFDGSTYRMARLMDCGYSMPDSVELRIIATQEGQEDTDLGWFTETELPAIIAEKAFASKRGNKFTVNAGMGDQTFEVLEVSKATPKVKLAIMELNVAASSKTYAQIYAKAREFAVNNSTTEAFKQAAKENNMTIYPAYNLSATTDKIGQLPGSRTIVRWAFEAKEGQVSDVYECGNQYVVAMLSEVNENEYRPMADVRGELMLMAMNNKKAEYIISEMNGINTLEEASSKFSTPIQHVEDVALDTYRFGNAGAEPAVVGNAIAMQENTVSAPIQGNMGVYMIKTSNKMVAEGELNVEQETQQLNMRYAYSLPYMAINIIQAESEVEDNRANFQ